MSRLRVTIDVNESGECIASMEFGNHDLEAEGTTPSESLQNLAETLALYEEDKQPVPEEIRRVQILRDYGS